MDTNEAQGLIRASINVTPQRVVTAKAVIVRSIGAGTVSAQSLLQAVLNAIDVETPEQLVQVVMLACVSSLVTNTQCS
jgi:hypothetical protein